jgi:hypothetical protein
MTKDIIIKAQAQFKEQINTLSGAELLQFALLNTTKILINDIYFRLYHKHPKGCDNCYMDAMIEITNINMTELNKRLQCEFAIKAGALLHDRNGDAEKMLCNTNVTNERALYHLVTNPGCEIYFSLLPADWQEQVDKLRIQMFGKPKEPAPTPVINPVTEGDIDENQEAFLSEMVTDPETLDNTVSIEKNPLKVEPAKEPEKPQPEKPKAEKPKAEKPKTKAKRKRITK